MTHPYTDMKEAAEKATPGPWHENKNAVNDIAYVVIANPTRILSLIEENERLREALERVKMITQDSTYRACVVANDIARAALKDNP